jgi:hypothetical protein
MVWPFLTYLANQVASLIRSGQDACVTGAGIAVADGDFEAVYVTGDGAECWVGVRR